MKYIPIKTILITAALSAGLMTTSPAVASGKLTITNSTVMTDLERKQVAAYNEYRRSKGYYPSEREAIRSIPMRGEHNLADNKQYIFNSRDAVADREFAQAVNKLGRNTVVDKPENPPAFPTQAIREDGWVIEEASIGMTLRDYFAAACLHSFLSVADIKATAEKCYEMADAMLKARQS